MGRWFGADPKFDEECRGVALPALESLGEGKVDLPVEPREGKGEGAVVGALMREVDRHARNADSKSEEDASTDRIVVGSSGGGGLGKEHVALALVLLLDQFPRNIFRGNSQALIYNHYDFISRAVAYEIYHRGLDCGDLVRWSPAWRTWFYMPLMHSENLGDHGLLEGKIRGMEKDVEEDLKLTGLMETGEDGEDGPMGYLNHMRDSERTHRGILERFGRYPHRNGVLGRVETGEERAWLEGGGSRFGTS